MKPGLYFNIPMAEYRAAEGVNISALKKLCVSPAHYKAARESVSTPSKAQIIGTIVHRAVLEHSFDACLVKPRDYDGRSKEGKEWLANAKSIWRKRFPGTEFEAISRDEYAGILGMIEAIRNDPIASSVLYQKGDNEVSCWKAHETTGLLLKGRADRLAIDQNDQSVVVDLKTTQNEKGHRTAFEKEIYFWRYDRQAAYYLDLFGAKYFMFVVVEKEPPYAVSCFSVPQEALDIARTENERDLIILAECEKRKQWPGYPQEIQEIGLPEWARRRLLAENVG